MQGNKLKNSKRIFSQDGFSASTDTRIYNLENNVYKVTYYEIISGTSGTLSVPIQATINQDEFGLSGNALLSKININNKPTYQSPTTLGGISVTASLNPTTGAWAVSGAYTDLYVALIYSVDIKAEYFSNLDNFYIIETANISPKGLQNLQDVTDLGNITTHPIEADYFVTTGGTASDFVKGDGSLDNNTYLTTAVTSVSATSPLTSTGGNTPDISTSMNTNKLIGRSTTGVGVMEEISLGTGLTLNSGTLSSTPNDSITHATALGTDTYTTTIIGVTSYADGDAYLIRFTNGNTTTCSLNINSLGAITLYRNNDGPLIGGDIEANAEMLCVYNLTANTFQCIGTSPNSIIAYVTNADSVTITKGQPVYAFGGQGDRMTVKLANNIGDSTSAQTVGLVMSSSIATNQKGFIMMQGLLDGLSILPTATWTDGDPVYLSSTAGTITNVKPYAPNHLVYLGFVTTASNGSAGRMYVRIQNGYELDELHNVQAQSPTLKDTLWYDNTVSPAQWKTASINTILGYTPANQSTTISTNSPLSGGGDLSANRTLSISQANTTTNGYLSSTDWTTFNNKEPQITLGTISQYWRGDKTWQTFPTIPTVTPSALTEVDDTNITLTLGGSPSTALLQPVSITAGWTGTLADSRIASAAIWNAKQNALGFTPVTNARTLTINGITYDLTADRTWTISTASNLEIKDEGTTLTAAATSINFTGVGVTASAVGTAVTVSVTGGGAASNLFNYYNFI